MHHRHPERLGLRSSRPLDHGPDPGQPPAAIAVGEHGHCMLRLGPGISGIAIVGRLGGMVVLWSATEQAINALTGEPR